MDPAQDLAQIVNAERDRIVRLWAKRLRAELHEVDLPGKEVRRPLERIVAELGRLLRDRGDEALWLFAETIRSHGIRRFEQRFDPEDVAREMAALHGVLLRVVSRASGGGIDPSLAGFLAALIGEATGSVLASYARALRTEEVRFREAAAMESVLHHLDTGILLVDAQGSVAFATPSVTRLIGLPARALLGAKAADALRLVLGQVRARHEDGTPFRPGEMPYVRALEEARRVSGVRMAIDRQPDGHEVVLEMSATPLLDEVSGAPFGVVQVLEDRTALARQDREQRALVARATGTAHALNNSLNVLRLKLALLRKEASPAAQAHLDEIERALQGAADQVRGLEEPAPEPAVEDEKEAPPARPARPEARRVLVVDDDVENARVTAEVLGEEGYDVAVAHDGKTASALWRNQRFDAALVDVVMPDVSGWELARDLRAANAGASIAMVTGADVRGLKREELERVDAVFRKPVDVGALDDFLSGDASI